MENLREMVKGSNTCQAIAQAVYKKTRYGTHYTIHAITEELLSRRRVVSRCKSNESTEESLERVISDVNNTLGNPQYIGPLFCLYNRPSTAYFALMASKIVENGSVWEMVIFPTREGAVIWQ
jgi:hypothetical protein